jgi:hypothetical protein
VGLGEGKGNPEKLGSGIGTREELSVDAEPGVDSVGKGRVICWM